MGGGVRKEESFQRKKGSDNIAFFLLDCIWGEGDVPFRNGGLVGKSPEASGEGSTEDARGRSPRLRLRSQLCP